MVGYADHKTVILSVDKHMKKFVRLPYGYAGATSVIPIVNDLVYFAFRKTLKFEAIDEAMTSSELFGVGEIAVNNNFEVKTYPLPIGLPMEKKCVGIYCDSPFPT